MSHVTHEDLFREPQFAPGTPRPATTDESAPAYPQHNAKARPRRTNRHHRAA